jgi:hypothetical protein
MEKLDKLKKTPHCLNCNTDIGDLNYCPNCGQQNVNKQAPLKDFFHDLLGDFFTFDHKLFRSFLPLLFKPGFLTKEYNEGRRINYILPIRLYIFISLIFFFLISYSDEVGSLHTSGKTNTIRIDEISNFMIDSLQIDSVEAYQMTITLSPLFDRITFNENGQNWYKFLRNHRIPDKLAIESTKKLMTHYDLKREDNFENGLADSLRLRKLIKSKRTILHTFDQDIIFNQIHHTYKHRVKHFDSSIKSDSIIYQALQEIFNKPEDARELTDIIHVYFRFRNSNDDFSKEYKIQDSLFDGSLNRLGFSFGLSLRYQIDKINGLPNGQELIKSEILNNLPRVVFLLLPIFALILKIVYLRTKIYYVNHLIFSIHAHAIMFIYMLPMFVFDNEYFAGVIIISLMVHIFISMKHVYEQSYGKTLIKALIVFSAYGIISFIGMVIAMIFTIMQV